MADKLVLFTGSHCPLCDQAKTLLYPLLSEYGATLSEVDISSHPDLQEKYGERIPVIQLPGGVEKGWPFTAGQLRRLLSPGN